MLLPKTQPYSPAIKSRAGVHTYITDRHVMVWAKAKKAIVMRIGVGDCTATTRGGTVVEITPTQAELSELAFTTAFSSITLEDGKGDKCQTKQPHKGHQHRNQ